MINLLLPFFQSVIRPVWVNAHQHRTGAPRIPRKVTRTPKRRAPTTTSRWRKATRKSPRKRPIRRTTGGERPTSWTRRESPAGRRRRARCSPGARFSSSSPPSTSSATWAARRGPAWPPPCTWRRLRWRSGSRTGGISGNGSWPRSWRRLTWATPRRRELFGFPYFTTRTGPQNRRGPPLQTHPAVSHSSPFLTTCTIHTQSRYWGRCNSDSPNNLSLYIMFLWLSLFGKKWIKFCIFYSIPRTNCWFLLALLFLILLWVLLKVGS